MSKTLTHLKELEAESIFILREVAAQFQQFPIAGLYDILPAEQDTAGDLQSLYIIMQAVQAFEQGALSAAGGTYDTGNLVSGEGKRHIFQDMRSADVYVQVMDS